MKLVPHQCRVRRYAYGDVAVGDLVAVHERGLDDAPRSRPNARQSQYATFIDYRVKRP
jgi:hypothetical protein